MDKRFLEALIHRDHKVLGYKLAPYCLAHAITLEAVGSPLIKGASYIHPKDILVFLKICSAKDPFQPDFSLGWMDKWWALMLANPKFAAKVHLQISAYLEDYCSTPQLTEPVDLEPGSSSFIEERKTTITAPWAAARVASLHQNTNLTDEEIFRKPLGYLVWLDATIAESKGAKINFYDPENPDLTQDDIKELLEISKKPMEIPEEDIVEKMDNDGWVPIGEVWGGSEEPETKYKKITPKRKRGTKKRRRDLDKKE